MEQEKVPAYVLCRRDGNPSGSYGGDYFVYDEEEEVLAMAKDMVLKHGWDLDNIMIFETKSQIKLKKVVSVELST